MRDVIYLTFTKTEQDIQIINTHHFSQDCKESYYGPFEPQLVQRPIGPILKARDEVSREKKR